MRRGGEKGREGRVSYRGMGEGRVTREGEEE